MPEKISGELSSSQIEILTRTRRKLHQIAEVSGLESRTAAFIVDFLKAFAPDELIPNVGGSGILAVYNGSQTGKRLLFRAELDALPIREINTFAHASETPGVSHKCGHDGHMACLLGLAIILSQKRPEKGSVVLLFQPAEENGEGAKAMLNDPKFEPINPDFVFAFHNLPGYKLNKLIFKSGSFTASVKSIVLRFEGKTAHAAEPENGLNPSESMTDFLSKIRLFSNNDPTRSDFKLITIVHVNIGDLAYGISAGYGEIHLTVRAWNEKHMTGLVDDILREFRITEEQSELKCSHYFLQEFAANENDDATLQLLLRSVETSGLEAEERAYPFKWGEDFGIMTTEFKGCMFGLGSGEHQPALHNPDYDFPDELIPKGIAIFTSIIKNQLN